MFWASRWALSFSYEFCYIKYFVKRSWCLKSLLNLLGGGSFSVEDLIALLWENRVANVDAGESVRIKILSPAKESQSFAPPAVERVEEWLMQTDCWQGWSWWMTKWQSADTSALSPKVPSTILLHLLYISQRRSTKEMSDTKISSFFSITWNAFNYTREELFKKLHPTIHPFRLSGIARCLRRSGFILRL